MTKFNESRAIVIANLDPSVTATDPIEISIPAGPHSNNASMIAFAEVTGGTSVTFQIQVQPAKNTFADSVAATFWADTGAETTTTAGSLDIIQNISKGGKYRVDIIAVSGDPSNFKVWIVD